ncbi:MAG: hypothetical protein ACM3ZV_05765 [Bacillota bacterium]
MDTRPQLFRETLRRRPTLGEVLAPVLAVLGAAALLALIVATIVWLNSNPDVIAS